MKKSGFVCEFFLLDLGNVLVKFDHGILARKLAALSKRPVTSIVLQFIRSGLGELYDEGKIPTEEFLRRAIASLELPFSPEELALHWNEIFSENPGMEALLRRIHKRFPVYVISDTNPLHFEYVKERFPVMKWVDEFILSYQIGVRKPSPRIFEEALRRAKKSAGNTFFADDRAELVRAAGKMGFHAYQFRDTQAFESELLRLGVLPEGPDA